MLELNKQQRMSFHSELYRFIPKDHLLVQVNELVDFSFIHDFVKDEYDSTTAAEPRIRKCYSGFCSIKKYTISPTLPSSKIRNLAYK